MSIIELQVSGQRVILLLVSLSQICTVVPFTR